MKAKKNVLEKLKWIIKNPGYLNYKIRAFVKNKMRGKAIEDDFDWDLYTIHYKAEIQESTDVAQILNPGDYVFQNNALEKINKNILSLHPNYHILYETILLLKPASVLEFGSGSGDSLHNLSILDTRLDIYAMDLSLTQIELLRERHPNIKAEITQRDITQPFVHEKIVDIAYSQAVIMHIQKGDSHLVALTNMFGSASKQVVLMENWRKHKFMDDIMKLHKDGAIAWKNLFFYYRELNNSSRTKIMIISSIPLSSYTVLASYDLIF